MPRRRKGAASKPRGRDLTSQLEIYFSGSIAHVPDNHPERDGAITSLYVDDPEMAMHRPWIAFNNVNGKKSAHRYTLPPGRFTIAWAGEGELQSPPQSPVNNGLNWLPKFSKLIGDGACVDQSCLRPSCDHDLIKVQVLLPSEGRMDVWRLVNWWVKGDVVGDNVVEMRWEDDFGYKYDNIAAGPLPEGMVYWAVGDDDSTSAALTIVHEDWSGKATTWQLTPTDDGPMQILFEHSPTCHQDSAERLTRAPHFKIAYQLVAGGDQMDMNCLPYPVCGGVIPKATQPPLPSDLIPPWDPRAKKRGDAWARTVSFPTICAQPDD